MLRPRVIDFDVLPRVPFVVRYVGRNIIEIYLLSSDDQVSWLTPDCHRLPLCALFGFACARCVRVVEPWELSAGDDEHVVLLYELLDHLRRVLRLLHSSLSGAAVDASSILVYVPVCLHEPPETSSDNGCHARHTREDHCGFAR